MSEQSITTNGTCIHGRNLMTDCLECAPTGKRIVSFGKKSAHQRAKDAVVEAARIWHKNDKGFTRIVLRTALDHLVELESKAVPPPNRR